MIDEDKENNGGSYINMDSELAEEGWARL